MNTILTYWITLLWMAGYTEFHLQLFFSPPRPHTLGISVWITVGLGLWVFWKTREQLSWQVRAIFHDLTTAPHLFFALIALLAGIFGIAAWESTLPPHHLQEYDAINYHMGLPRQHLIAGTLKHLSWSAADLWPQPIQMGFAPFWFMGEYFHKIPQFLAALWAFGLLLSLGRSLAPKCWWGWIPALAVFTTHGVVIQLGTAMLDLTLLYFLLGFIHAAHQKKLLWAAIHLALFITAKAFSPLQVGAVVGVCTLLLLFNRSLPYLRSFKNWKPYFLTLSLAVLFSLLLLSRSSVMGVERAGTPLFPFGTCILITAPGCQGEAGQVIRQAAESQIKIRNQYGTGRDLSSFVRHLWIVSVPTQGVNNEYDYPLGLSWVLLMLLFLFSVKHWLQPHRLPLYAALALGFWSVWWMGSQQSRWLYPVLAFGWLAVLPVLQKKIHPRLLLLLLIGSASFSLLSEWRAYRMDAGKTRKEIQTEAAQKYTTMEALYADQLIQPDPSIRLRRPDWLLE